MNLDDTLNSSSIELGPVAVVAQFAELESDYGSFSGPYESIRQVGQQIGPQGYTVTHSFDDGLPDPVTATGQNDASGSLQMDLLGRPSVTANPASLGWNTGTTTGSGTGTTITTTLPGDIAFWDYVICAVTVSSDALLAETSVDPSSFFAWKLLGDISDGGAVHTYVFGKKFSTFGESATVAPVFSLAASAGYAWAIGSIDCAKSPSASVLVPVTPGDVEIAAETTSVTAHNQTPVTVGNRGWTVGVFGAPSAAGTWTSAGNTIVAQTSGGGVSTALVRSALRTTPGLYNMTANTGSATGTVAMVHIAFEVRDRPEMDAVSYFSPFNTDSPIYGFERDTAVVQAYTRHLDRDGTAGGYILSQIFQGQMADIKVTGRTATMTGISKTRLDLDGMLTVPPVYGARESCTTDWITTWIMARGGQFAGPAPTAYTRLWVPFYGSLHAGLDGPLGYNAAYRYSSTPPYTAGALYGRRYPPSVPGPFVTGMYAQYTDAEVWENLVFADRQQMPGGATELGFAAIPLHSNDIMSQANNKGRVSFWVRGDVTAPSSSAVTGAPVFTNTLFRWRATSFDAAGTNLGQVDVIMKESRDLQMRLGSTADGFTTLDLTGHPLPTDGEWHYISVCWDWDNTIMNAQMDGTTWTSSGWATTTLSNLPVTEEALYAAGGHVQHIAQFRIPCSDLIADFGAEPFAGGTSAGYWPSLSGSSGNTVYRATDQYLEAVAEQTPSQGWTLLNELAQATLSHYRCDEADNFNFLPLSYFGEPEQMTVSTVEDTDVNAAELDVVSDPSKTRNVVSLQFSDTRADTNVSPVMQISSAIEIPRGVTSITFALEQVTAEIHGAANAYTGTDWDITKLTSAQIASPATIPTNVHYMTVNTAEDGSGTVWTGSSFSARITMWSSSTVTIRFTNSYTQSLWLANNGSQVAMLNILGWAVRDTTAYTLARDAGSIGSRRERSLDVTSRWVHRREDAEVVAGRMVNLLARPRDEVTVEVVGDPRRKPGQLVELKDSQGTKAQGTWRILSVQHNGNGPQYTQTLQLLRVYPSGNWDDAATPWDAAVWAP